MNLDMDFTVARREFALEVRCRLAGSTWGIFGPSGAGKTTLFNAIAGLTTPAAGRIALDGQILFNAAGGVNVPAHRRHIGCVFQENRLFGHLNVRGNLSYANRIIRRRERRIKWDTVVDLLKLDPLLSRPIGRLSGGERRRVAIGRALLASPRLLLLDEPLTGLDQTRKQRILGFLRRISQTLDIGMLLLSHEPEDIIALTDQLLLLEQGRMVCRPLKTSVLTSCQEHRRADITRAASDPIGPSVHHVHKPMA